MYIACHLDNTYTKTHVAEVIDAVVRQLDVCRMYRVLFCAYSGQLTMILCSVMSRCAGQ